MTFQTERLKIRLKNSNIQMAPSVLSQHEAPLSPGSILGSMYLTYGCNVPSSHLNTCWVYQSAIVLSSSIYVL